MLMEGKIDDGASTGGMSPPERIPAAQEEDVQCTPSMALLSRSDRKVG
jgi:hypothetical protein